MEAYRAGTRQTWETRGRESTTASNHRAGCNAALFTITPVISSFVSEPVIALNVSAFLTGQCKRKSTLKGELVFARIRGMKETLPRPSKPPVIGTASVHSQTGEMLCVRCMFCNARWKKVDGQWLKIEAGKGTCRHSDE